MDFQLLDPRNFVSNAAQFVNDFQDVEHLPEKELRTAAARGRILCRVADVAIKEDADSAFQQGVQLARWSVADILEKVQQRLGA